MFPQSMKIRKLIKKHTQIRSTQLSLQTFANYEDFAKHKYF